MLQHSSKPRHEEEEEEVLEELQNNSKRRSKANPSETNQIEPNRQNRNRKQQSRQPAMVGYNNKKRNAHTIDSCAELPLSFSSPLSVAPLHV